MLKCEKCGKDRLKMHESYDNFGEFFICYECATLETFEAVDREVKIIRQQRNKAKLSG